MILYVIVLSWIVNFCGMRNVFCISFSIRKGVVRLTGRVAAIQCEVLIGNFAFPLNVANKALS